MKDVKPLYLAFCLSCFYLTTYLSTYLRPMSTNLTSVSQQEDVTEVDEGRQAFLFGLLFVVFLTVLPFPDDGTAAAAATAAVQHLQ